VQSFRESIPCQPDDLSSLRRSLERWLFDDRVSEEARAAVVLAAHEAAGNVIEHLGCTEVRVEARIEHDQIYLEVYANGGWQSPDATGDDARGWAFALINHLMDSVAIDEHDAGVALRMRRSLLENLRRERSL